MEQRPGYDRGNVVNANGAHRSVWRGLCPAVNSFDCYDDEDELKKKTFQVLG